MIINDVYCIILMIRLDDDYDKGWRLFMPKIEKRIEASRILNYLGKLNHT